MQESPAISFDLLHRFLNPSPESSDLFAGSVDISDSSVLIGSFVGDSAGDGEATTDGTENG
ncbi:MAG: hypothetical protein AAGJ69_08995, partial [Cyanobacteria bacterium J06559_1]